MVALSASRLVCAAIEWISLTTSPIFSAPVESAPTVALVRSASPTALLAISLERATWREISATELESSSAADATVPTLSDERCDAASTVAARALASLAVDVMDCAVVCMPAAAVETERTMPVTLRSKSLAIFSIAARRSAAARACVWASACSSPRIRTALSLKIWTVAAIAPTSSPRPTPGISPSSLPSASSCMREPSWPSGLEMLRPIIQAMLPETSAMPRMASPSTQAIGFILASRSSR